MKKIYILLVILGFVGTVRAQVPSPAPTQSKAIALKGGTIHVGNGTVIENGLVAFDQGKLTYIGPQSQSSLNLSSYEVTDVSGQHIYPGLILLNNPLGLVEIGAVSASVDDEETGDFNPNVRAIVAYNTDSDIIPTIRSNGILLAQVTPGGGMVAGSSSVVQLDAWNWEDAAYKTDEGIHLRWPARFQSPRWWLGETESTENKDYYKIVDQLEKALADGKAYSQANTPPQKNRMLEAMRGLYDGSKTMYYHANESKAIVEGIQTLMRNSVKKIVLVGGNDAYYVRDFLKANNIPVIISDVHRLPSRTEEDVDMPFKLANLLQKEGLTVCLSHSGAAYSRNLPFYAGTAAAYGLGKEEALKLITSNPAKILGIDAQTGTLEKGKDAILVVSKGDILDMLTNEITHAFIQGRKIDLNNKHKELYEKFKAKYEGDSK